MPKIEKHETSGSQSPWAVPVVALAILAFGAGVFVVARRAAQSPTESPTTENRGTAAPSLVTDPVTNKKPELLSMEVAKAVMVTVELEFPGQTPTIAAALSQIERRYSQNDSR